MTEDHAFMNSGGEISRGRVTMISAWKPFFARYPCCRRVFQQVTADRDRVTPIGRGHCQEEPILDGPVLWTALVRGNQVAEWRVVEDKQDHRQQMGLA